MKTMFTFKRIIILLFLFFNNQYFIYADRLLIGLNQNQIVFKNTEEKIAAGGNEGITTCPQVSNPDLDNIPCGIEENKEYDTDGYNYKYEPNLSVEINFGVPSKIGIAFFVNFNTYIETILINYPKNNTNSIVKSTARNIGVPLYYTWGDENLGANGSWSFRLGLGPGIIYFDPITIATSDGQTETKRQTIPCTYIQIAWDWKWFSLSYDMFQNGNETVFNKVKDDSGEPAKMVINYNSYKYSYSYYF